MPRCASSVSASCPAPAPSAPSLGAGLHLSQLSRFRGPSHFPGFRAGSGSGGSADGRQRQSSTYPQAFVVNLARRVVAEALVLALFVIEAEPGANAGLCLGDTGIGMQVDLLILQTAPQPLDEDVVHTATFAIHADGDTAPIEHCDDLGVGELAALVGVEDLRPAVSGQRFLQGLDAEVRAERVR